MVELIGIKLSILHPISSSSAYNRYLSITSPLFKFDIFSQLWRRNILVIDTLVFWGISKALKRFPQIISMIKDLNSSQKILEDHLKDIPLIGSLVLQVDLCLLLLSYFLFLEYTYFLSALKRVGCSFYLWQCYGHSHLFL